MPSSSTVTEATTEDADKAAAAAATSSPDLGPALFTLTGVTLSVGSSLLGPALFTLPPGDFAATVALGGADFFALLAVDAAPPLAGAAAGTWSASGGVRMAAKAEGVIEGRPEGKAPPWEGDERM